MYVRRLRRTGVLRDLDSEGLALSKITRKSLLRECDSIPFVETGCLENLRAEIVLASGSGLPESRVGESARYLVAIASRNASAARRRKPKTLHLCFHRVDDRGSLIGL